MLDEDRLSALDAITAAQRLAFAPRACHATSALRDLRQAGLIERPTDGVGRFHTLVECASA